MPIEKKTRGSNGGTGSDNESDRQDESLSVSENEPINSNSVFSSSFSDTPRYRPSHKRHPDDQDYFQGDRIDKYILFKYIYLLVTSYTDR